MPIHRTCDAAVSLIVALVKEHPGELHLPAIVCSIIDEAGYDIEAFARDMIDEEQSSAAFVEFLNREDVKRWAESAAL